MKKRIRSSPPKRRRLRHEVLGRELGLSKSGRGGSPMKKFDRSLYAEDGSD